MSPTQFVGLFQEHPGLGVKGELTYGEDAEEKDDGCNIATLSSLTLVGSVSSSSSIVLGIEMSRRRSLTVQRAK